MSVADHHPDYDKLLPLWQRAADTIEGQNAIHFAGERYLAKLSGETSDQYKARLGRADFFNATWRTLSGLSGMAFAKDPVIDIPPVIESYAPNINMAGVGLDDFAKDLLEGVLSYGRMGLMVDMPPAPEGVTALNLAAYESLGMRPMLQLYGAEHVINWRFGSVRNQWVLTMVVLLEQASIAEDEFEHKYEVRYRVLDLDEAGAYRQRVFRKDKDGKGEQVGDDIYPVMSGKKLGYLPFCFVGMGGKADAIDVPPMIDLIDANIAHYQVNADYRHGLHFTGLPTPVVSGYSPEKGEVFTVGSLNAFVFPDPNAKAYYLEFTGAGLSELREAMNDLQKRMAVLGARMLTDETRHAQTLGEAQIKHVGENSILAATVIAVSRVMEWGLGVMSEWAGSKGEVVYQINRDFTPMPLDAQTLTALVGAWQAGAMSEAELFATLQRGDIVDAQKTLEEHQEEVASTPAMPKPAPVEPGPGVAAAA